MKSGNKRGQTTLNPFKPTLFRGDIRKLERGTRFPKPLSDMNSNQGPENPLPLTNEQGTA